MHPDEEPCPIDLRRSIAAPSPLAAGMSASKERRSGSETRQRQRFVAIRLTDEEHARVRLLCDGGQSVAALCRTALLASPLPRRRPRTDHAALARLLAELQAIAAELGKQGSNLNQLAHQANADRMLAGYSERLEDALAEHAEQGRTLLELRDACLTVLGS